MVLRFARIILNMIIPGGIVEEENLILLLCLAPKCTSCNFPGEGFLLPW